MFKKIFPLFILLFGFGSLVFSQDVNSSGAFTYSYPINIPPGTNGMAPQLSLDYNSQGGNGMVGMGWSLSGFQTITRDSTYDIKWDNSDHFLLNGQRLIPDGGYNYRTENESFLKIQYYEHFSLSFWIVTQKNGTKYYFGNSENSRIECIGNSAPRVWALNKVMDVHGNYYTIEYDEDTQNGDYYPVKIVYTMNEKENLQKFREVVFTYEERDDHWITYNPSQKDMDERLKWITVNVGGNLLRKYELQYNDLNSVADRSKLKSIQEYGSDGKVLPITKIEWQPFSIEYSDAITIPKPEWLEYPYTTNYENRFILGTPDINGDGLADILFKTKETPSNDITYEVSLSNGDNYKPAYKVLDYNSKGSYYDGWYNKDRTADVNGDGRDDILIPESNENYNILKICLSDGDTFKKEEVWLKIDKENFYFFPEFIQMTDVNGDGLADLLFFNGKKQQLQVCFSTGDGFTIGPTIDKVENPRPKKNPLITADINGDGRSDIILQKEKEVVDEVQRLWKAYIFTGTEFELYKPADWTRFDDGWTEIEKTDYRGSYDENAVFTIVDTPDINGDGFADLLFLEHREKLEYKIRLSTGSGYTEEKGYRYIEQRTDFLFSIDTNGDGRKDILKDFYYISESKAWGIKPSNGSFFRETPFYIYQKDSSYLNNHIEYNFNQNIMIRPLDYNGDGSTDLLTKHYNNLKHRFSLELYKSNYSKDLIASITLPTGAKISPAFTPAPQVPNAICPNDSSYPYVSNKSTRPLVTSLTVSDGMGNNYESTYDYYNGKTYIGHSRFENKSMGFEWTKKKNHDGTYTKTYYYQEEKLLYAGAIKRIENYGSDGLLYTATENKYITKQIKSSTGTHSTVSIGQRCITMPVEPSKDGYHGVYSIQKSDSFQYNFNGVDYTDWETVKGLPGILKIRTSYRYDSWGNTIRVVNYGELGNDSDNSVTTTKYIHDETTNISVPQYTESHSFGLNEEEFDSALLEEEETLASFQEFFYDGSTVSGDIGAKGELSRKITYSGFTKEEDLKKYPNLITNYKYDIYGNIETIIDGNGNKTTISYDDNYKTLLKSKINALGQIVETIKYDDLMRPQYAYNINNKQTRYTYDSFGRYVRTYSNIYEYLEDQAPTEVQLSYTFHSDDPASPGNPICTETGSYFLTNPNKYIETYTYSNGLGQKLQEKTEGVDKNDDPVWITTDYHYDIKNKITRVSKPYSSYTSSFDSSDWSSNKPETTTYMDAINRVKKIDYPDGHSENFLYEINGKLTLIENDQNPNENQIFYDEIDGLRQISYSYPKGNYSPLYISSYTDINEKGKWVYRVTTTEARDGARVNELAKETSQRGNPSASGNTLTTIVDNLGRKISYTDPDMGVWRYEYDNNSNLIRQLDARAPINADDNTLGVTTFKYDELNRTKVKHGANKVYYCYDGLTFEREPVAATVHGPSASGKLTGLYFESSGNDSPYMEQYYFDDVKKEYKISKTIDGKSRSYSCTVDELGGILEEYYPQNSEILRYHYNDTGNIDSIISSLPNERYISGLRYNILGKITDFNYGNSSRTIYDYDENDRLTNINIINNIGLITDMNFKYDGYGNISEKLFVDGFSNDYEEYFSYDELFRLEKARSVGLYGTKHYQYDPYNNITVNDGKKYKYDNANLPHAVRKITDEDSGKLLKEYTYDANGNVATITGQNCIMVMAKNNGNSSGQIELRIDGEYPEIKWNIDSNEYKPYTWYGDLPVDSTLDIVFLKNGSSEKINVDIDIDFIKINGTELRPKSSGAILENGIYSSGDDYKINYRGGSDLIWNGVITYKVPEDLKPLTRILTYDSENHLISTVDEVTSSYFGYNDVGQRIWKIENGIKTYYFFDKYEEEYDITDGKNELIHTIKYYFANEQRVAQRSSRDGLSYYHQDHLGSACRMTNKDGVVIQSIAYAPFGKVVWFAGKDVTNYTYTDQESDMNGFMYYDARYYDPDLGRFLQPDPMLDGMNRYTYCGNNPIRYSDPTGFYSLQNGEIFFDGHLNLYDSDGNYENAEDGKILDYRDLDSLLEKHEDKEEDYIITVGKDDQHPVALGELRRMQEGNKENIKGSKFLGIHTSKAAKLLLDDGHMSSSDADSLVKGILKKGIRNKIEHWNVRATLNRVGDIMREDPSVLKYLFAKRNDRTIVELGIPVYQNINGGSVCQLLKKKYSIYHGPDNMKWIFDSGQEIVMDMFGNLEKRDEFRGTYNFGQNFYTHFKYDMKPYYRWGCTPRDKTPWIEKVFGPNNN